MKALQRNLLVVYSIMAMLLFSFAAYAASDPIAPTTLTRGATSGFNVNNYAAQQTTALAGNITFLTINSLTQTRTWQGYYGNITGYITLDDANNFTFYNWSAAEPRGQVFASLVASGTPTWSNVICFSHASNATNFHTFYNISQDDPDNVTITYPLTSHATFYINNNSISGCPTTYIWRDDQQQVLDFTNVLLNDNVDTFNVSAGTAGWIFGTIIENNNISNTTDHTCYNGAQCDFQLLVAENGHGTDISTTAYYFWVDIQ